MREGRFKASERYTSLLAPKQCVLKMSQNVMDGPSIKQGVEARPDYTQIIFDAGVVLKLFFEDVKYPVLPVMSLDNRKLCIQAAKSDVKRSLDLLLNYFPETQDVLGDSDSCRRTLVAFAARLFALDSKNTWFDRSRFARG
jgi:hypothetical protein